MIALTVRQLRFLEAGATQSTSCLCLLDGTEIHINTQERCNHYSVTHVFCWILVLRGKYVLMQFKKFIKHYLTSVFDKEIAIVQIISTRHVIFTSVFFVTVIIVVVLPLFRDIIALQCGHLQLGHSKCSLVWSGRSVSEVSQTGGLVAVVITSQVPRHSCVSWKPDQACRHQRLSNQRVIKKPVHALQSGSIGRLRTEQSEKQDFLRGESLMISLFNGVE